MGRDKKSANVPKRNLAAIKHQIPVMKLITMTNCQRTSSSPIASGATAAAITAQVAASGPIINCLDVPNNA